MTATERLGSTLGAVTTSGLVGQPATDGRWQPTRAGVVNSWAWGEEHLQFADGWLALTGPNGSGKSLTASMLVTLLLDADSSQTALSVSGKAAGTLTSRHTDWNDKEDRTGAWWLEYGKKDSDTGTIEYLTTGLWLRSVNGTLHRAFFLVPGRVGTDLTLQHDREPVRIDDLAEQLANCQGELFTSSSKLRGPALGKLRAVEDERGYRQAIRTRLFSPLDDVQFDALTAVLRSLRSLRTAEAISPRQMQEVLSNALPALDPERLTMVAEAMERIADLETQLQRNREESALLGNTDGLYRRYITSVSQVEAADLISANTEFDLQARRTREETTRLRTAQAQQTDAERAHATTRIAISELEGRRTAADEALRDHAGAELPHMEQRAQDLAKAADDASQHATQIASDAESSAEAARESVAKAAECQQHLDDLTGTLRSTSAEVGADAALEHLLTETHRLTDGQPDAPVEAEINQTSALPLAWAEARATQLGQVREALNGHELAQHSERSAAEGVRDAEDEEDRCRSVAGDATGRRNAAESALIDHLIRWSAGARHLGPVPAELTDIADDEGTRDRIEPDRLAAWLQSSADSARVRIDLSGHQQRAAADAATANAAAQAADDAQAAFVEAQTAASEAAEALEAARHEADAEAERTALGRVQAEATHDDTVTVARVGLAASEQRHSENVTAAAAAAEDWIAQVHRWRSGLVHLSARDIAMPELSPFEQRVADASTAELTSIDAATLRLAVERAHSAASTHLERRVSAAERDLADRAAAVTAVEDRLATARQAAQVPTAPPWRDDRQPDGGAPLWALVDFAEHLSPADANRIEGALLVAGLLDALVTHDGRVVAGDVTITSTTPAAGRTLADLLRVEDQPIIDVTLVAQVLRAIPIDSPGTDFGAGRFGHGVLTAAAPDGYEAAFIGRTARERARLQQVARREEELRQARGLFAQAERVLGSRRHDVVAADAERRGLPSEAHMLSARARVTVSWQRREASRRDTAERIAQARLALHQVLAELDVADAERQAGLVALEQEFNHAERVANTLKSKADHAKGFSAERRESARRSIADRDEANAAQTQADAERAGFPDLTSVRDAHREEDDAANSLTRARATAIEASERHRKMSDSVREALRTLNVAATLPDGSLLPTDQTALRIHEAAVQRLALQVERWEHAAQRAVELLHRAHRDAAQTSEWQRRSAQANGDAEKARLAATRQAARVAEQRKLYGAEYEQLRNARQEIGDALEAANQQATDLIAAQIAAAEQAAAAQSTLDGIAPQREAAERRREHCLQQLCRLVDERLATPPQNIATDSTGRPANLTAGLAWAKHILADRPATGDRVGALTQARGRALTALENSARTASAKLARFDKQVTLVSIDGTEWRRAVVAEPDATRGADLHRAVEELKAVAAQLEEDLRDDVKRTLKTSMFTQLRRDIQVRREAAQELVRHIRTTLGKVRTGVANVGVQIDWTVRDDEDARRMVELISQPPSDEVFEQMYAVLRQRMDESAGEAWAARVAHTFDYRAWHEWHISVTHSSFGDGTGEKFKAVTTRSNPLESLSTGERRLATMLPLLAAAWSMYSGEHFHGPRLLSIDEIDAAFDEPNLRQVLALLRRWQFDVLATAPFMTPLIKQESQHVVVHQVMSSGQHRISVPWLWKGHGEPIPLTLDLTAQRPDEA